jgi:circadian clock protein KaiC
VLFEVSPDKIIRDAGALGWNLPELEQTNQLKIIFTTREVFYREIQQSDSLLLEEARGLGARRIFVDGLAMPKVEGNGNGNARDVREQFHVLSEGLQRENLTAMLSTDLLRDEETNEAAAVEELVADTIIRLRLETVQRAVQRSLEILKSRGQNFQMGRHTFAVVDGRGIEVYRRVQAPRGIGRDKASAFDVTRRVTTGIPGLDELVNGAIFWEAPPWWLAFQVLAKA